MNDKRLPYNDVPAFLRALRNSGAADGTKDALEWLILTATRTNETLGARLSEVREKSATWTVSPERTQSNNERVVPLSARALQIFAACKKRHSGKGDFLFESKPGQPLNNMDLAMQMRRMKSPGVPHGFRYSFRAWAADRTNASREGALAHVADDETGSGRRRTDFLESRRKLMIDWSKYCASVGKILKSERTTV